MTEKKTSEAQLKATRKWEDKNREHTRKKSYQRTTRLFIRNHANEDDLSELEQLIAERRDHLEGRK